MNLRRVHNDHDRKWTSAIAAQTKWFHTRLAHNSGKSFSMMSILWELAEKTEREARRVMNLSARYNAIERQFNRDINAYIGLNEHGRELYNTWEARGAVNAYWELMYKAKDTLQGEE